MRLKATLLPENADDKKVDWSTSNRDIAKVVGGRVTGLSAGVAIITIKARASECYATCVVTVKDPTGIDQATDNEVLTLDIYDLAGRPIRLNAKSTEGLEAGTYIINGRKVVIK